MFKSIIASIVIATTATTAAAEMDLSTPMDAAMHCSTATNITAIANGFDYDNHTNPLIEAATYYFFAVAEALEKNGTPKTNEQIFAWLEGAASSADRSTLQTQESIATGCVAAYNLIKNYP